MIDRSPHIHTMAHDPGRVELSPTHGTADWWRERYDTEPDWWRRVFSQPFRKPPEEKPDGPC